MGALLTPAGAGGTASAAGCRRCALPLLLALSALTFATALGQDQPPSRPVPRDPAEALLHPVLSPQETRAARALFEKLDAADFDEREAAQQKLCALGPAVLPLIEELAKGGDVEVASRARSLRTRIILNYEGFWAEDPGLRRALNRPLRYVYDGGPALEALERLAKEQDLELQVDPRCPTGKAVADTNGAVIVNGSFEETLFILLRQIGVRLVPRGNTLLVTTEEHARHLIRPHQALDWGVLGLDRDEARRVAEGLAALFPERGTELNSGSEALSLQGEPACFPRAARLIALLHPDAPAAQWPPLPETVDPVALLTALSKPASVSLNAGEFAEALAAFGRQGHAVSVKSGGQYVDREHYPTELLGLSPISLNLKGVPLGFALRWLCRRADFPGAERGVLTVRAEVGEDGRIRVRVAPKVRELLSYSVGGMDVKFLTPGGRLTAEADRAAQAQLVAALAPVMDLCPDFVADADLRVLHGRMLVQGSPAAVATALDLVRAWQRDGKPPACAWREGLTAALDRMVEWDGRGLTGGKVLRRLRELGGFTLLLEDAADGEPAAFELTREQAELLPPGQYTVGKLLSALAEKVGARWEVRWGLVTLSPDPKAKKTGK